MDTVLYPREGGHVRFLKHDNGSNSWDELGSCQIRDKAGHALREIIHEIERAQRKKCHPVQQVVARVPEITTA